MTLFPPIGSTTADFGSPPDHRRCRAAGHDLHAAGGPAGEPHLQVPPGRATRAVPTPAPSWPPGHQDRRQPPRAARRRERPCCRSPQAARRADELNAGLAGDAAPGARRLADGAGHLSDGLGSPTRAPARCRSAPVGRPTAAAGLTAGAQKIAAGNHEAASGGSRLADGNVKAQDGSGRLAAGLGRLSSGADRLDSGIGTLHQGSGALKQGSGALALAFDNPNGVDLVKGSASLVQGLTLIQQGLGQLDAQRCRRPRPGSSSSRQESTRSSRRSGPRASPAP